MVHDAPCHPSVIGRRSLTLPLIHNYVTLVISINECVEKLCNRLAEFVKCLDDQS